MSKLTEALNILANTDCTSFKRSEPTAEEALEWLNGKCFALDDDERGGYDLHLYMGRTIGVFKASTPLEAIRNAMKGESDE